MLNPSELKALCCRLNVNEPARKLIDQIRSSGPARRVGGGRSNVSGIYPSRKMGVTIQFESHRVELAAIYAMEHDPLTLEFYDQPPSIVLDYDSAKGKRLSVRHTPDFFVLRQDFAGWEEWKTEEDLKRLTEHNPNRYCQEVASWHCPPGERYATQFGLSYRVRCAKEIDWRLQRNILFLHDYLHADPETIHGATRERILACVRVVPVISLADLIRQTAEFATPDDIYLLIASGRLYVDLGARVGLGALLVGYYEDGEFVYAGKVGTGFDGKLLTELRARLGKIERPASPFTRAIGLPRAAHWVKPEVVAQIAFLEWTGDGKLRHSRFLHLRTDKDAKDVVRESR